MTDIFIKNNEKRKVKKDASSFKLRLSKNTSFILIFTIYLMFSLITCEEKIKNTQTFKEDVIEQWEGN